MQMKPYPKYKESGIEWIGEIPEEWEVDKVKHYKKDVKFSIVDGPFGTQLHSEEYVDDGIPVVRVINLTYNGDFVSENMVFIRKEKYSELKRSSIKEGDILIAKTGATIGKIGVFSGFKKAIISSSCLKLSLKGKINHDFFKYLLISDSGQSQILSKAAGSTRDTINIFPFSNLYFCIPSKIKEQQKIASFLDKKTAQIDVLIEKYKKLIELLKEKRTALINHAVTKGLDPNVKMRDSGIEWIGKIPGGWKTSRLRFLGDSIIGLTYSPNDIIEEGSNSNLILRASNIQNNKLSLHDNIYVNKRIPKKLITKKGDILICSRNGSRELIGKNICIDERTKGCSFGAFMTVYRTKYWRFMSLFFNSQVFKSQSSLFSTTTINQLTISTLNNFYVAIPSSIEEQLAIVSFLDKFTARIDKTIQKIQKKIELLEEYKKSLIHHVVTGKVDVREVKV